MGTTAAREAARERIMREAASGNGRGRGRQHAEEQHLGSWDGSGEASDGRNDGGSDGDDGGNEEGLGYRRSPITPAAMGRWGGEYVSTRTHPLAPNPPPHTYPTSGFARGSSQSPHGSTIRAC